MLWSSMASLEEEVSTTIIKSDRTGRPRYTERYKEEVLAAYGRSGMSGPAFARHCGVKYPTFAAWVTKRRREGEGSAGAAGPSRQHFVLAEIGGGSGSEGLEIDLPGGARARLSDARAIPLLAELIKALTK